MKNKYNLWLILGTVNHIIFLAVIFIICAVSRFECSGNESGAVMVAYTFSIFIPQLLLEVLVFAMLIIILIIDMLRSQIIDINKNLVISFLSTLIIFVITIFVA